MSKNPMISSTYKSKFSNGETITWRVAPIKGYEKEYVHLKKEYSRSPTSPEVLELSIESAKALYGALHEHFSAAKLKGSTSDSLDIFNCGVPALPAATKVTVDPTPVVSTNVVVQPKKCTCDINAIMVGGCKCGGK